LVVLLQTPVMVDENKMEIQPEHLVLMQELVAVEVDIPVQEMMQEILVDLVEEMDTPIKAPLEQRLVLPLEHQMLSLQIMDGEILVELYQIEQVLLAVAVLILVVQMVIVVLNRQDILVEQVEMD
jgi:hypothetical protein